MPTLMGFDTANYFVVNNVVIPYKDFAYEQKSFRIIFHPDKLISLIE